MAERIFHNEVRVPEGPETIFKFFSDAKNLNVITPPWLDFQIVTPDVKLEKGSQIEYRLKWRGLPLRWISEIAYWNPPHSFVDKQIKGPYKTWIHKHEFVPDDNGTRIIDEVRYSIPGAFLEPLIHKFFVGPDVRRIFEFRMNKISALFNGPNLI